LKQDINYLVTDEKCLPPLPISETLRENIRPKTLLSFKDEDSDSQSILQNETRSINSTSSLQNESVDGIINGIIRPELLYHSQATQLANELELSNINRQETLEFQTN
jgi:hypothetical protein